MASKAQQERRAEFKRYKEDVAKEGKPFFPYAILHDTIMSLVVVVVIIGLAVIWKWTSDDGDIGPLGPLHTDKADPGTTNFVPRPDWFFYFLFYPCGSSSGPRRSSSGRSGSRRSCSCS